VLLTFWKERSWENGDERTCVCHQFIFAASMTKQSSCGTIGRRPPMLRDHHLGGDSNLLEASPCRTASSKCISTPARVVAQSQLLYRILATILRGGGR
jgi:hypothetical protein